MSRVLPVGLALVLAAGAVSWGQSSIPVFQNGVPVTPAPAPPPGGPITVQVKRMPPGETMEGDAALKRALKNSSLTYEGKPFHAVLTIGTPGTPTAGSVEVWWVNGNEYRVKLESAEFRRTQTATRQGLEQKQEGDFLPQWLQAFEEALLDPVPVQDIFRNLHQTLSVSDAFPGCMYRDDRPNGITDERTRGQVCFLGRDPKLVNVDSFNYVMSFSNWSKFGKKEIARDYHTPIADHKFLAASLTLLEELKNPDAAMSALPPETGSHSAKRGADTVFVSTLHEESMVEKAPEIAWPGVREGRTDGYMIIYARTDKTGQVREAHPYNSDNAGVQSFGAEQALRYKFKPLVVDGEAVQMEMPLVLHFTSRIEDPIPILSVAQMKEQMISCTPQKAAKGSLTSGSILLYRVSVDENGKYAGEGPAPGQNILGHNEWYPAEASLQSCTFKPYVQNGKPTYYKGDIELVAP